jgi:hypothetical protein
MKYFKLEPTLKKSIVELTVCEQELPDGVAIRAEHEQGWRSGTFIISVPETAEEVDQWLADHGYDIEDFGMDIGAVRDFAKPASDSEYYELDDYDYVIEALEDSCWSDWNIEVQSASDTKMTAVSTDDDIAAVIAAAWEEQEFDGVEALGYTQGESRYEITSTITLTECDEDGNILGDE